MTLTEPLTETTTAPAVAPTTAPTVGSRHPSDGAGSRARGPETTRATVRYMYAVCQGLDMAALDGAVGLRGLPLQTVHHGHMTAVVSRVPLTEYGTRAQQSRIADLEWLEDTLTTHAAVLDMLAAVAATVPLRLGTVAADEEEVSKKLHDWQIPLTHALDRVEGSHEWRVRVVHPDSGAETPDPASTLTGPVHAELSQLSVASRILPLEDTRLSGHDGVLVHHGAYLVPTQMAGTFRERLTELAADARVQDPAIVIDGQGPQPAYAFAMVEQS